MAAGAWTDVGGRGDSHRPAGGDVGVRRAAADGLEYGVGGALAAVVTEGRFEMGIGTGRPGIEESCASSGLPVTTPGERLAEVRDAVTALRELDGPDAPYAGGDGRARAEGAGAGGGTGGYGHVRLVPW